MNVEVYKAQQKGMSDLFDVCMSKKQIAQLLAVQYGVAVKYSGKTKTFYVNGWELTRAEIFEGLTNPKNGLIL